MHHRSVIACLAVVALLAGCSQPDAVQLGGVLDPDLSAYLACPVVNGTEWPCEPDGDNPTFVEVGELPPLGWRCLSFADQRFDQGPDRRYPFPNWYTFFGPAIGGDRAPGEFQLGFRYDALNDTEQVLGVATVMSEDEELQYVWQGPPAGFVRLPVHISDPAVWVEAVLYPMPGPTLGLHNDTDNESILPDPVNNVTGAPSQPTWSRGPWEVPAAESWRTFGTTWQWNLVQTVQHAGQALHAPGLRDVNAGHDDPRDLQGAAHWGQWRQGSWNATVPGVHTSVLTPYMEFYFETKNIHDAAIGAVVDFLCRCPDQSPLSYEGVWCALGRAPPIVEAGVVRGLSFP